MERVRGFLLAIVAGTIGLGGQCTTEPTEFGGGDDDTATESSSAVIITEVMANPNRVADQDGEWFEIYNPGDEAVDMTGWSIGDAGGNTFTIGEDELVVAPGAYAVLGANIKTEENGGVTLDFVYPDDFTLGNSGDSIIIEDAGGVLVDAVAYDSAPDGASLSLDPGKYDPVDNDDISNFCATRFTRMPGGDLGTPGALNDACFLDAGPGDVVITEIMAYPLEEVGDWGKYIEFYNTTLDAIRLDGWVISDGSGDTLTIASNGAFVIPSHGYAVVGAHAESTENGGVSLDYSWGNTLVFDDMTDTVTLTADNTVVDTVTYGTEGFPGQTRGVSIQLDPSAFGATENDDGANWCLSNTEMSSGAKGTPGAANTSCQ